MSIEARADLVAALNVLVRRRQSTPDTAEQLVLDQAIDELSGSIRLLNQATLLQAASIVAQASDELEKVVASARMGPFDNFLSDIEKTIDRLQSTLSAVQGQERLPSALAEAAARDDTGAARGGAMSPGAGAAEAEAEGGLHVINSRSFSELKDEYEDFFGRCTLRPEFAGNVEFYTSRLVKFRPTYEQLGQSLGIPWIFIGVVHGMECGFNFKTHLHNGDPLSARTTHVPAGRPANGEPPFTWLESARDALVLKNLDKIQDWSFPRMLHLWETYNGFGYRFRGMPSPYLWSFSNLYTSGKFTEDGKFSSTAVSKQCGAGVMLKVLQQRGLL